MKKPLSFFWPFYALVRPACPGPKTFPHFTVSPHGHRRQTGAVGEPQRPRVVDRERGEPCGFTPQYEGLEALSKKLQGRRVDGARFPANNFTLAGNRGRTRRSKRLLHAVQRHLPLFAKISVKGSDQHPLYRWLTEGVGAPTPPGRSRGTSIKFWWDGTAACGRFRQPRHPGIERL